jgi:hypothetical protein
MLGKIVVSAATASPTPSPTVEPTPTTATVAPTTAPTVAALPKTSDGTIDSGVTAWRYVLLASEIALVSAGVVAFSGARRK